MLYKLSVDSILSNFDYIIHITVKMNHSFGNCSLIRIAFLTFDRPLKYYDGQRMMIII